MKRKIFLTILGLTMSLNLLADPGNGNGNNKMKKNKEKNEKNIPTTLPAHRPNLDWQHDGWYGDDSYYQKNWGFSKDNFRSWLNRHPNLNKKDRKSLEKLYKDQLTHEKKLRKSFQKYDREISLLPAYRNQRDPMGAFIEDYLYRGDSMKNYRFSDSFRNEMNREEKATQDFFRFLGNFR
ncbi:MAG: hypothetical protein ACRCTS_07955 [Fusobacteriaceae bacterium]